MQNIWQYPPLVIITSNTALGIEGGEEERMMKEEYRGWNESETVMDERIHADQLHHPSPDIIFTSSPIFTAALATSSTPRIKARFINCQTHTGTPLRLRAVRLPQRSLGILMRFFKKVLTKIATGRMINELGRKHHRLTYSIFHKYNLGFPVFLREASRCQISNQMCAAYPS